VYRSERYALKVPLRYRKGGAPDWHEGSTINISRTGILFCTDQIVPPNLMLEINVELPRNVILSCQGAVVRNEPPATHDGAAALAVSIQNCRLTRFSRQVL